MPSLSLPTSVNIESLYSSALHYILKGLDVLNNDKVNTFMWVMRHEALSAWKNTPGINK